MKKKFILEPIHQCPTKSLSCHTFHLRNQDDRKETKKQVINIVIPKKTLLKL